ncbi:MAG: hypothetical protein HAW59_00850 [Betaproteobacteria bacterium]|nr:hypothetical protein [Betaproteobacteria bacterium]
MTAAGSTGASITGNVLSAAAAGTVEITATAGEISNSQTITITPAPIPVASISINSADTVEAGTDLTLTANVLPADATDPAVTWSILSRSGAEATINENVLTAISGGTDIVSCFALGNPLDSVRRGELQCRGLGMAVAVYDESGKNIVGAPGELVCTAPHPCMPLGFGGDADGAIKKYHAAYFQHFPGVWRHGDWATLAAAGGMVIHGRSDATLNPGGVRIGTAEIYRAVERFPEVAEALAAGQEWEGDVRVVLFVRPAAAAVLDGALRERLRAAIRRYASPRHAPAKIIAVSDIPRTRSGKISEIAVREVICGRPVKNINALANPESLEYFRNLPELSE